jgi:hypothetical protein
VKALLTFIEVAGIGLACVAIIPAALVGSILRIDRWLHERREREIARVARQEGMTHAAARLLLRR